MKLKSTRLKKGLLAVILVFTGTLIFNFYPKLKDISSNLLRENYAFKSTSDTKHSYLYEFAVLNKSFERDLERSANLYKSYEKYFFDAENTPYFIVVPLTDLELFKARFDELKENNEISILPKFLTEQEVLEKCGEPDVTHKGTWAQQVVKLCFGILDLAENYISLDSDTYFTQPFNPKVLFEGTALKTFAWKMSEEVLNQAKKDVIPWFTDYPENKTISETTGYNNLTLIKDFLGNKNKDYYGYVSGSVFFSSNALHRMKNLLQQKGGYKFAMLIRIAPYEGQWYGEYVLQHEKFIPTHGLFILIDDAEQCFPENAGKYDDGNFYYGICYQSLIYVKNAKITPERTGSIVYKRPSHCDKLNNPGL